MRERVLKPLAVTTRPSPLPQTAFEIHKNTKNFFQNMWKQIQAKNFFQNLLHSSKVTFLQNFAVYMIQQKLTHTHYPYIYIYIYKASNERDREKYSVLPNSESFPRLEKMIRATSASHSTESSKAFLSKPFLRFEKVTWRLILFSILSNTTLPLPMLSLSLSLTLSLSSFCKT